MTRTKAAPRRRSEQPLRQRSGQALPRGAGQARSAQDHRLLALEHLFKAMADRTRLRILALLSGGETCVCDIYAALDIPQPRASRHLAYLRKTGLVIGRKEGLWVYYRLANPEDPVMQTLTAGVQHCLHHVCGTETDTKKGTLPLACCAAPSGRHDMLERT